MNRDAELDMNVVIINCEQSALWDCGLECDLAPKHF